MELNQVAVKPTSSARKRKCSSCGNDPTPRIDVSIPGLNRLLDNSYGRPKKIIWSILMLCCAVICVYLTVHQLFKFFEFPIASKTFKQSLESVQFPSFSICAIYEPDDKNRYAKLLEKEIKKKCRQRNCEANFRNINISDLNISLDNIWDQCHLKSVEVTIESLQIATNSNDTDDYKLTKNHCTLGSCVIIRHTGRLSYFSALTRFTVSMKSEDAHCIVFLPHGEMEDNVQEYDYFKHEFDYLLTGWQTILKVQHGKFLLQNTTHKECYEYYAEREKLAQLILVKVHSSGACRLPFLPDGLPECLTYDDVNKSITIIWKVIVELWSDANVMGRRSCNYTNYAISIDYVAPLKHATNNEVTTELVMKFTDDSILVTEEYFSYTFPALVSDLFAYWGFFLCLSAFVFAEIFEFLIRKFYLILTHFCTQHK